MLGTKYPGDKLIASDKISLRMLFCHQHIYFLKPFYDHGDSDVGDIVMLVTILRCWCDNFDLDDIFES